MWKIPVVLFIFELQDEQKSNHIQKNYNYDYNHFKGGTLGLLHGFSAAGQRGDPWSFCIISLFFFFFFF